MEDRDVVFRAGMQPFRAILFVGLGLGIATALFLLIAFPWPIWQRVLAAMIVLWPAPFLARGLRVGPHFKQGQLEVVRSFRSVKLPWERVRRFVIRPRGIQPLAVFAELVDGTLVWIEGVGPTWRFAMHSAQLESVVRAMNRELERRRPQGSHGEANKSA